MKPLRTISALPTLFTLGNLVCGFYAIVVASRIDKPGVLPGAAIVSDLDNILLAAILIFAGMLFDAIDGHVARLAGTSSDFGAQLDSLCDLVSFGVAPAFLLVKMCPRFEFFHPDAVWIIAASFASCAALRLARFNVENDEGEDQLRFSGLPSPGAAGAIAGFGIVFYTLLGQADLPQPPLAEQIYGVLQTILPFFAVLLALLMVSRVPYPHATNQLFRGQKSFAHVVGVIFALVAVWVIRGYAVPLVFCLFALVSPIRYAWEKIVQRRHQEEPVF
jgi:CDP-diacylglycerol---serine O-phosphatidyltransferase